MRLVVGPEHAGLRIDRLVVELLAKAGEPVARAEVQRWIAEGRVRVAGEPVTKKATFAPGTSIDVDPAPPATSDAEPDPNVRFEVVYEDEHLLVVDKPAGLVVHPARGHAVGTLVNGLLARGSFRGPMALEADPRDPQSHQRPGIVHRLDKDTSGLLVVAKDAATREGLKELFSRHDIDRSYLAIVVGEGRAARYDTHHGRHPKSRVRFTSLVARGKRACTRVELIERYPGASLVRCTLETGRTHQIRVHLMEQAKTPILGDPLYGQPPADPAIRRIGEELGRQALHAAVLGFRHPIGGASLRFESPLPDDFERARAALTRLAT